MTPLERAPRAANKENGVSLFERRDRAWATTVVKHTRSQYTYGAHVVHSPEWMVELVSVSPALCHCPEMSGIAEKVRTVHFVI